MLDEATRTAILKLHEQGHGSRTIAQAVGVARATVRQVIDNGSADGAAVGARGTAPSPGASRSWSCTPATKAIWAAYTRNSSKAGASAVVSGADRVLPAARDRPRPAAAGRPLRLRARRRRCSTTPRPTAPRSAAWSRASRRPRWCCATRGCSSSNLSALHALLLQGLPHRRDSST